MLELRFLEQEKGNLLSFPNWQLSQICSDLTLPITSINPLFFKNCKAETGDVLNVDAKCLRNRI